MLCRTFSQSPAFDAVPSLAAFGCSSLRCPSLQIAPALPLCYALVTLTTQPEPFEVLRGMAAIARQVLIQLD
jgi:hypothetical protein